MVFSDQLAWKNDIAESSRMLPDGGQTPVSTSPILAGTIVPLDTDTDRTARLDDDWKFWIVGLRVFGAPPGNGGYVW